MKIRISASSLFLASALLAGGVAHAQYTSELGKLAPEALKPSADRQEAQLKQVAPDLLFLLERCFFEFAFLGDRRRRDGRRRQQHPADARRLLGLIRKVTDKPIKWLVVTHAHGDHFLGNPVFKAQGATIISQRDTRVMMQKYYKDEVQRREAYFKMNKLDAGELQMVLPEVTFDSRFTIHLGGKTAELITWGLRRIRAIRSSTFRMRACCFSADRSRGATGRITRSRHRSRTGSPC